MSFGFNQRYLKQLNNIDPRFAYEHKTAVNARVANPLSHSHSGEVPRRPAESATTGGDDLLRYPHYNAVTRGSPKASTAQAIQLKAQRPAAGGFNFLAGYNYNRARILTRSIPSSTISRSNRPTTATSSTWVVSRGSLWQGRLQVFTSGCQPRPGRLGRQRHLSVHQRHTSGSVRSSVRQRKTTTPHSTAGSILPVTYSQTSPAAPIRSNIPVRGPRITSLDLTWARSFRSTSVSV